MGSPDPDAVERLLAAAVSADEQAPTAGLAAIARLGLRPDDRDRIADVLARGRAELARLRRREHELGALFASARELAELRDADAVLGQLVDRAHEMMGCDVTYLSEFDPASHDLHVRRTVGAVTEAFRTLRVPAGKGLAGRIAETRSADAVVHYTDALDGRHDADIDAAVAAEGIVSILGCRRPGSWIGSAAPKTRHARPCIGSPPTLRAGTGPAPCTRNWCGRCWRVAASRRWPTPLPGRWAARSGCSTTRTGR